MSCTRIIRICTYLRVVGFLEMATCLSNYCLQRRLPALQSCYGSVSLSDVGLREAKSLALHYPSDLDATVYPRGSQTGVHVPLGVYLRI